MSEREIFANTLSEFSSESKYASECLSVFINQKNKNSTKK